MLRILQFHESELGDSVRVCLYKKHGIPCETVREPAQLPNGGQPPDLAYALYSYVRPSNGEKVWIIELDQYEPPDMLWTRSWVVDCEPSFTQALTIIKNKAQTGSMLE